MFGRQTIRISLLNLRDSGDHLTHGSFYAMVTSVGVLDDPDVQRQRARSHVDLVPLLQHALHNALRRIFFLCHAESIRQLVATEELRLIFV